MTPERWQKVKEVLQNALERETNQRTLFLEEVCAGDPELRAEVESLLTLRNQAGGFLELPISEMIHLTGERTANLNNRSNSYLNREAGQEADLLIGRTLGEFTIREKIGEGGFGSVYRAEQLTLNREAVIKVLHARHRGTKDMIERFMREARLASRLEHPYTAHVYAFGAEADGLLWIAMELVHGTTLDKLLGVQGPLSPERFVPLLDKICEVVETAHEQGIIHRDLKPANVMVISRAGRLLPKLLDFGIAKLLGDEATPIEAAPRFLQQKGIEAIAAVDSLAITVKAPIGTVGVIGSPYYMAPEQWQGASLVDARTDIYALGVLTYEVITSRPPFHGSSFSDLSNAHTTEPVPPLGASFPAALDKVMAKVMAKCPENRYQRATEFAAAFRETLGFTEERASLPQLDELLQESLLASAPQPLAQAVANLRDAHNAHQARDRMVELFRVTVRYLGLLALACRARIGSGEKNDSEETINSIRKLCQHSLSEEEWIKLARELCKPFANQRDAYPIPELVSLFFNHEEPEDPFELLLEMQKAVARGASGAEEQARDMLSRHLPKLAALLRALSFLSDYRLVVPREDYSEIWMGLNRARAVESGWRTREDQRNRPPLLKDGDGRPILSLWPLMQVTAPAPGAGEEVFFLEGRGRHGAKLVAMPSGFELHDESVWGWFRANFFNIDEDSEVTLAQDRTPYPGLVPFTPADAEFFFGREREAETFLNRLRVEPLLAVVGPSGAGKSSFVQAGLIPELPGGCRAITVRPGPAPLTSLAARLVEEGIEVRNLRIALEHNPNALGEYLRAAAEMSECTLMLVIDQFEELFTLCQDQTERRFYSEALARAARSAEDPVRIVLTLRDDFLMRAEQMPCLGDRLAQRLQLLNTPAPEDLMRILTEPARRAGYEFEDREMPSEIVQAVANRSGALPLLAFTAAKLWELRDRQFKQLRRKAYEAMGGVGGALAEHAETLMREMAQEEQRIVREAFRHLITSEGTRAVLTRPELIQVLGGGSHAEAVVEKLISVRLLVASEAEGSVERIEIVHEALLEAWPRLKKWRQEDAEGVRLRDQLRAAARQWEERGRAKGLLWRDEALKEYEVWRSRYPGKLTESEEAFGTTSLSDAARGRRMKRFAAGTAFSILLAGLFIVLLINNQVKQQLLDSYEEQGRQELFNGNSLRASVYLSEAYKQGKDSPSLRLLLAQSMRTVDAQLMTLEGHKGTVLSAVFSPDGTRIVTGGNDNTAKVWDAATGSLLFTLEGHKDAVRTAAFSPNGKQIVTASDDNTVKIWDAETGQLLTSLESYNSFMNSPSFSPDGTRIVTGGNDNTAKVWDVATGSLLFTLEGHKDAVRTAAFSPNGKQIVTASRGVKIWDVETGQLLAFLEDNNGFINSASFSPDNIHIVTAGISGVQTWEVTGRQLALLQGFKISAAFSPNGKQIVTASAALSLKLSPDGKRIVTVNYDETAKVWDAATGSFLFTLEGHKDAVRTATFSPDGKQIVTASDGNTIKIWDAETGQLLTSLEGHLSAVLSAVFSPDGRRIVSSSADGTARVWNTVTSRLSSYSTSGFNLISAEFTPDGGRIITADKSNTEAKIWDAATGKQLASLENAGFALGVAKFTPDGKRIVTSGIDRYIRVWDAVTGKQITSWLAIDKTVSIAFSPDGRRIVLTAGNNAQIWDVATGDLLKTIEGHTDNLVSAAFSPDGQRIVTASLDRTAKVWDVATGKLLVSLLGHRSRLLSATFSPDGQRIVTASDDRTAKVWDAATGKLLFSLEGHTNMLVSACFSQDGKFIATLAEAETIKLWDVSSGKLLIPSMGGIILSSNPLPYSKPISKKWLIAFSPDSQRIILANLGIIPWGDWGVWDVHLETRSPNEIAEIVKQRVPFRLDQGRLIPTR